MMAEGNKEYPGIYLAGQEITWKQAEKYRYEELGSVDCSGATFVIDADFKGKIFHGPVDFREAVFEKNADFSEALFLGDVDFTGAVFLGGVSFKETKFGRRWERKFGDWEIAFRVYKDEKYVISRRQGDENKEFENWKVIGESSGDRESLDEILISWGMEEHSEDVAESFAIFRGNPADVSFTDCRFGEFALDGFTEDEIKTVAEKEGKRISEIRGYQGNLKEIAERDLEIFKKYFSGNADARGNISPARETSVFKLLTWHCEPEKIRGLIGERHEAVIDFSDAEFHHKKDLSMNRALHINNGSVEFRSSTFSNAGFVDFGSSSFNNAGEVYFISSTFSNAGDVYFISSSFSNAGDVYFSSSSFSNAGFVDFRSSSFSNAGSVSFSSSSFNNAWSVYFIFSAFSNAGSVNFISSTFSNAGDVNFIFSAFSNAEDVNFGSSTFSNAGDVYFESSTFSNAESVSFSSSAFSNLGSVYLLQMIFVNGASLYFSKMEFGERKAIKWDECLFLPSGNISFEEARFPEQGSLMFQRCYFARASKVDFTGTFFRHTSFEGGEISWLVDEKMKKVETILNRALSDEFKDLPEGKLDEKTKELLGDLPDTQVFAKGVKVLWKDLTAESARNLIFRLTNLSHSIFDGITPSLIHLNAPKWLQKKGRSILYEEELDFAEEKGPFVTDLENLENQYTQFKNNLESQGNYQHAGDFHYGEQEMRREILWRESGWKKWLATPTWFYKQLSGYGERPLRALFMTLAFVLLMGGFNFIGYEEMKLNFEIAGQKKSENTAAHVSGAAASIESPGNVDEENNDSISLWVIGFRSLILTLTPFSWKLHLEKVDGDNFWRYGVLIFFQIILFTVQIPLLILAVRRRFKR